MIQNFYQCKHIHIFMFKGAFKIGVGHLDAIFFGRRIPARVRCRAIHHVLDLGNRVANHTNPVPRHVHVDAGLAAVVVNPSRWRAERYGIAQMVTR